jgi:HemY protein
MKWLFGSLIILLISVFLSLLAYQDPGYVLIAWGYKTAELSLSLFIILYVISLFLFYFIIRIAVSGWHMPVAFKSWRQRQRHQRARRDTNKGLVELAQGNWTRAERYLVRHASDSETPLINYLSAARAAQKQSAPDRRDNYLALAHKNMQGAGFAVQLTQAELQLVHGQLEQSLATLVQLHATSPKHPHVLFLLARIYEMLRSWGDLQKILPELKKYKIINSEQLKQLERVVYRELITIATQRGKLDQLKEVWQRVPKTLRQDIQMSQHYTRCLLTLDAHDDAESIVRDTVKRSWDDQLVYIYGLIEASDSDKQLATAENWLKGNENNPVLLLTLGRLCKRNKLWGKAQSYLDASIGIQARSDSYKELGQLMEQLEEPDKAASYFRQGLLLAQEEKLDDLLMVVPTTLPVIPSVV